MHLDIFDLDPVDIDNTSSHPDPPADPHRTFAYKPKPPVQPVFVRHYRPTRSRGGSAVVVPGDTGAGWRHRSWMAQSGRKAAARRPDDMLVLSLPSRFLPSSVWVKDWRGPVGGYPDRAVLPLRAGSESARCPRRSWLGSDDPWAMQGQPALSFNASTKLVWTPKCERL